MSSNPPPVVRPVEREPPREPVRCAHEGLAAVETRENNRAQHGPSPPRETQDAASGRRTRGKTLPSRLSRPRPQKLSAREDLVL
jgi:hypothetical protein